MAFCSKCGAQLGKGMMFCGSCGERTIETQAEPQISAETRQGPIVTDSPLALRALTAGQEIQRMGAAFEEAMEKYEAYVKPRKTWKECTWLHVTNSNTNSKGNALGVFQAGGLLSFLSFLVAFPLFILGIAIVGGVGMPGVPIALRALLSILCFLVAIPVLIFSQILSGPVRGFPDPLKAKKAVKAGALTQEECDAIGHNFSWKARKQIDEYYRSEFLPALKAFETHCRGPATLDEKALLENLSALNDYINVFYRSKSSKETRKIAATNFGKIMVKMFKVAVPFALSITAFTLCAMAPGWKTTFSDGSMEYSHTPGNIL